MTIVRIIVPIKQVPSLEHLKFDNQSRRLIREGVPNQLNTFDRRAVTEAVHLIAQHGGEVVALTMGPPQAKDALMECLMMGADRAVHLLGREFAGADTLATARTLAMACRRIGYDLILCGKTATDAETAQVPPMLAELLDLPQVMNVLSLRIGDDSARMTVTRETDEGTEMLECTLPALLSAGERLCKPIRVGPADAPKAEGKPYEVWSAADLDGDPSQFGLNGSPTWVEAIYSIEPQRKRIMLDGDLQQATHALLDRLREEGYGRHEWKSKPHQHIRVCERIVPPRGAKSIWVVAETMGVVSPRNHDHSGQALRAVTLELMGAGLRLANPLEGELAAVVLSHKPNELVNTLAAYGADKVYTADSPLLARYTTEAYTHVLAEAIRQYRPFAVLFGATASGRDLAPRVAARLGLGLTGDAIGVDVDEQGRVVMLKPAFGGNIVAPILSRTTPALVTIRPGMMQPPEPDPARQTILMRLPVYPMPVRTRILSQDTITEEGVALDNAEIVIGVGTGVGGPENLPVVHALADKLHAHVAATRKVVDYGWMPPQTQVGLTGKAIAPRVYLMLGVSGQFNHMVGVQRSGVIVAVCDNPDAPVFKQCDYGIVADWRAFAETFGQVVAQAAEPAH